MAHDYCPYELVFGKTSNLPQHFNSIYKIKPLYNVDDYAQECKFRLEQAFKRARLMLESHKKKQKIRYEKNSLDFDLKIGDQVLLKNETGHKLDFKYTGPYKVESIEENDNIVISNNKNKKQTVHRDMLKIFIS